MRLCFFIFLISFIAGCGGHAYAPIEEGARSVSKQPKKNRINKGLQTNRPYNRNQLKKSNNAFHKVRKGETLYAIAWAYGLDYKTLAKWNKIKKPFTIYIGDKIRVKSLPKKYKVTTNKIKRKATKKLKAKKIVQKNTKTAKMSKKIHVKLASNNKLNWSWPIKGKVIQQFNLKKDKKGIDIGVTQKGLKIKAAESGKVVYSGHGLTGYGLLLIIKHNKRFLSAYAHNSKLLVNEGMDIKRNQVIALSGKTAADRVKLHFEIRLDGKPVNPLHYLK